MTDTTRDLIQRLADELDHYKQLLMDNRRKTHPLAIEARAYLAQPEPEGLTLDCDDIDVPPWHRGDDFHIYKEGYASGWSDAALAADRARCSRPTTTQEDN